MALNPRLRARLEREREQERRLTREQKEGLAVLLPEGRVRMDEPTSHHSVIRAGGPVEALVVVEDMAELKIVLEWCETHAVEHRFWGEGAFTLVRDGGLAGIIIKLGDGFREIRSERSVEGEAFISAGAAARPRELVSFCEREGCAGAERLTAAQGTLAGLICTASLPGDLSLEGLVEEITIVTREMKELTLRGSSLRFEEGRLRIPRTAAVTRMLLKFKKADAGEVTRVVEEGMEVARDPDDQPHYSVVFKSDCKTPAADLIYDAGLSGVRVGGARVSTERTSSIVNEGEARARDIAVLLSLVKDRVKQGTGVVLTSAVEVVGEL